MFVTINAETTGKYKKLKMNGRIHTVVNALAIGADSVMNRIFYPSDLTEKNHLLLNNQQAPLGHPKIDGDHVSASNPLALNAYGIGAFTLNSRIDNGNAYTEIWIDDTIANNSERGKHALNAIMAGDSVGVSTGLRVKVEPAGHADYDQVVTNFEVDHLAILIDKPPAGSTTYIQNEEKTLDKLLVLNALQYIGVVADAGAEISDASLIDSIRSIKIATNELSDEDAKLFTENAPKLKAFLVNEANELKQLKEKIVKNSSFSDGMLDKMTLNELSELEKLTTKKIIPNKHFGHEDLQNNQENSDFKILEGS